MKILNRKTSSILFFIGVCVQFNYCSSNRFEQLKAGMKESNVQQVVGKPDRIEWVDKKSKAVYVDESILIDHPRTKLFIYDSKFGLDHFLYFDENGSLLKVVDLYYLHDSKPRS